MCVRLLGVVDVRPRGNIPTVIRLVPLVAKPFHQNHQTASMSVLNHKLPMSSTASHSTSSLEEIPAIYDVKTAYFRTYANTTVQ
jgi:hypothetical protein